MKTSNGYSFSIDYVIYPYNLIVSVCQSNKDVEKLLKGILPEECHEEIKIMTGGNPVARTIKFSSNHTIIRFNSIPTPGIIAHEVFHVIHFLFTHIGITLSDSSDEAYTYLLQYVVDKIYQNIKQ
jgi:hypothetical protein